MKKYIYFLAFIANLSAYAQCAMCRATVETHARTMENKVSGLNSAILYLLIIPYLSAGIFWYVWKTNKKKIEDESRKMREQNDSFRKIDNYLEKLNVVLTYNFFQN